MADQVLRTDKIAGDHILDDPNDPNTRGYLLVEKRSDGEWYDAELDCRIEAQEGKCLRLTIDELCEMYIAGIEGPFDAETGIITMIVDEEYREFAPDPGECERVGIPVKRLRH